MPHVATKVTTRNGRGKVTPARKARSQAESRYTVGLASGLAHQVERFAATTDASMSKAIATLVRLGLKGQDDRKRVFFRKLKENLSNDDPKQQDRLVDEFRSLVLGQ
jgi:hypothetical protein